MTRDELENLIYERTRCFVDVPVADCIFDLIAAEREACAKVCEETLTHHYIKKMADKDHPMLLAACADCAAAIRARNNQHA